MSRVPPLLKIDPEWPATADSPNWVAICAAEWDADNYFYLSGHIGVERGQYCVDAINQYAALQKRCEQLEADAWRARIQVGTFMAYLQTQYPAAESLGGTRLQLEVIDFVRMYNEAREAALSAAKVQP